MTKYDEQDEITAVEKEDVEAERVESEEKDGYVAEPVGKDDGVSAWAGGRVEWSPEGGLTGIRPVVDHYSTTRYSDGEYRKHNEDVLCASAGDLHRINMSEFTGRRALECLCKAADRGQAGSSRRLMERVREVERWGGEVGRAAQALDEESRLLEEGRARARRALTALAIVKSIAGECLTRRGFRDGYDLTRDNTEEELIKEVALATEVSGLIERTVSQIDEQLARNHSMKSQLDEDWSNKRESVLIDSYNLSLSNRSDAVMARPAATRLSQGQLSDKGWETMVRETLATAEIFKNQSAELRTLLEARILTDCVRDLKAQADKVDIALARGIAEVQQIIRAMYNELEVVVCRNADSEKLILDLEYGVRGLEKATKVAQTRLDNRLQRPGNENANDKAHLGLINEVKTLAEQTTSMKAQLKEAQSVLSTLVQSRSILEKELQNKLKTLYIDRERCQVMRAQYPSATALSGN